MIRSDVHIGMPMYDGRMCRWTRDSFERAVQYTYSKGLVATRTFATGSMLPSLRNQCVEGAKGYGSKWLMFIDADMVFPDDGIMRLIEHDVDIVGGTYFGKGESHNLMASVSSKDEFYKPIEEWEEGQLMPVTTLGTGFMLIKMHVFDKIKEPYFNFGANKRGGVVGEDYTFCEKARLAGFKVFLDTGLLLGHVGEYIYSVNDHRRARIKRDDARVHESDPVEPALEVTT